MFHFLFRAMGLFLLALAVVLAVLDITRSITASSIVLTPLAETWEAISPQTMQSAKETVERFAPAWVWDPVITFFLGLPSWLVVAVIALALFWLGQKSENPYGRFASR